MYKHNIDEYPQDVWEEIWIKVPHFRKYAVNPLGDVMNRKTGRLVRPNFNQYGTCMTGLYGEDGKQYQRSTGLLVASIFLEQPNPRFDTPIHLDGDRANNAVYNLAWRPRWFATRYQAQMESRTVRGFTVPIMDVETGEIFNNGMEAAMKYGLIELDIFLSYTNYTYVFPTGQRFAPVE